MQDWIASSQETQTVAILLLPRFSNHCLANAVEPLRAANEILMREAYRWRFVTLDGGEVVSSSGLPVVPHGKLRDEPGGTFLFVMSSYDFTKHATAATSRALAAAARRFEVVAGLDTGAWLMAQAGLLEAHTATIHWAELTGFSEAYPEVDSVPQRYVIDGNRMTCGGAMATFDFVLDLIRRTHGSALGLEVSAFFMHQSTDAPLARIFRTRASPLVERGLALMSAHLETPLPIGEVAKRGHATHRTLARAFQAELGASPAAVYKRLRLAAARRYAQQSSYSIAEIAVRCGYANAAAMTRAFVQEYGRPPSTFRAPN